MFFFYCDGGFGEVYLIWFLLFILDQACNSLCDIIQLLSLENYNRVLAFVEALLKLVIHYVTLWNSFLWKTIIEDLLLLSLLFVSNHWYVFLEFLDYKIWNVLFIGSVILGWMGDRQQRLLDQSLMYLQNMCIHMLPCKCQILRWESVCLCVWLLMFPINFSCVLKEILNKLHIK